MKNPTYKKHKSTSVISALVVSIILISSFISSVYAQTSLSRVVDNAELLSDSEQLLLEDMISDIATEYEFDVVIVTTNSTEGSSIVEYADDFFDFNGYGYGEDYDGILFALDMGERNWAISTTGYGLSAFTDYGTDLIGEKVSSYLSDGDYSLAMETFVSMVEQFLVQAESGASYDVGNSYKSVIELMIPYFVVLGLSLIITIIIMASMKSRMKTLKRANIAKEYIKDGSFNLRNSRDRFLYSNVVKVAKQTSNSGGKGGTSSHRSSSGSSHGGSHGSF